MAPTKQVLTRELWTSSTPIRQIVRDTGLSRNTVKRIAVREGWPPRSPDSPMKIPATPGRGIDSPDTIPIPDELVLVNLKLFARNRTESHEQVLRTIMKLRCHLESWIDQMTAGGRVLGPKSVKQCGHALAWLERIESDRQKLILSTGKGQERFNLVNEQITRRPPSPGDLAALPPGVEEPDIETADPGPVLDPVEP